MMNLKLSLKDMFAKVDKFRYPIAPFAKIKSQLRGRFGHIYPLLEKRRIFIPKFKEDPDEIKSCFIVEKFSLGSGSKDIRILNKRC